MSVTGSLHEVWAPLLTGGRHEQDPGFREVILRLSRKGMHVICALALGSILFYTAAHLVFISADVTWAFNEGDASSSVTMWDKLLIAVLSLATLFAARSRLQGRGGRFLVAAVIVAAEVILLVDDVARGSLANSPVYLVILMLFGVGTMPFRPGQMLLLGIAISSVFLMLAVQHIEIMGTSPAETITRRMIPLVIATLVCTGISALVYRSRVDQYVALKESERLRDQLLEQARRLVEMEQAKSQFFANVSHEFRQPLTLILDPLRLVLAEPEIQANPSLRLRLGLMRRNARRLHALIDQLLDLSKSDAGKMTLQLQDRDLIVFLRRRVLSHTQAGVSIGFKSNHQSLIVAFDGEKLGKVVDNLISNAVKFTPLGGKVLVTAGVVAAAPEEMIEIVVRDTGIGIPPDELPHIFDRFYQVAAAPAVRRQSGTGIGLALAKELVDLHGGSIRAESEPGFGSAFHVQIPSRHLVTAVAADPPPDPVEDLSETGDWSEEDEDVVVQPASTAPDDAPLVLVVDDNPDMRLHLRSILNARYRVIEAGNGREGLRLVREHRPALVLSDVMMPEMDGVDFCRALREDADAAATPIVLLTARVDEESRHAGLSARPDDYLVKPFTADELETRVENLIAIRRLLQHILTDKVSITGSNVVVPSADAKFLAKVKEVIEANLANSNFGVEWLADAVGYHPRQLQRKIHDLTGVSTAGYIRMLRLERASNLLASRAASVSEIAYQVGYNDVNHFSRLFKQIYGMPPSEYAANRTAVPGGSDIPASPPPMA